MVAGLYFAVLVVFLASLPTAPNWAHDWWQIAIGPAILVVQLAALSLFVWGLAVWDSKMAWIVRVSAWSILFVGLSVVVENVPMRLIQDLQRGDLGSFFIWDAKEAEA